MGRCVTAEKHKKTNWSVLLSSKRASDSGCGGLSHIVLYNTYIKNEGKEKALYVLWYPNY